MMMMKMWLLSFVFWFIRLNWFKSGWKGIIMIFVRMFCNMMMWCVNSGKLFIVSDNKWLLKLICLSGFWCWWLSGWFSGWLMFIFWGIKRIGSFKKLLILWWKFWLSWIKLWLECLRVSLRMKWLIWWWILLNRFMKKRSISFMMIFRCWNLKRL